MNPVSRRIFLARTGVAAGAIGASGLLAGAVAADPLDDTDDVITDQPVIARVRNVSTGEISLYVGEEEISIVDRALARRLARVAR